MRVPLAPAALALALALGGCVSAKSPTGAVSPAIAAPAAAAVPIAAPAGRYEIDNAHTSVIWRVSHFGLSMYTGRFNVVSGMLDFDPAKPEASKLSVSIDAKSVDTGFQALGQELDFNAKIASQAFGADQHPKITFVSTAVTRTGPATGRVTGDLTLNGVTRPATLDVTYYGDKVNPMNGQQLIGFAARGTIDRTQWGVDDWAGPVGAEVEIVIETELTKAS